MNEALAKAQEIMHKISEVINKTLENQFTELMNLEDKAVSMISGVVKQTREEMEELAKQSEIMKQCVSKKESEVEEIQTRLKNKLVECYKKHYNPLHALQTERSKINESASQLKLEAQKMVTECMKANEPMQCFRQSLTDLAKKAEKLAEKLNAHLKKEAEIMLKSAKLVKECDQRAIAEARQKYSRIIEDIKKCSK